MNEAETCRTMVRPNIEAAGWTIPPHTCTEQDKITDGRIVVAGNKTRRLPWKFSDFLLRYQRDFPLAVVEAKSIEKPVGNGMQQAKRYAEMLGLRFALASNGRDILEFDYFTGVERFRDDFPTLDAGVCALAAPAGGRPFVTPAHGETRC